MIGAPRTYVSPTELAYADVTSPSKLSQAEICYIRLAFMYPTTLVMLTATTGVECIWNDAAKGEKLPSGHYEYSGGTTGSR